MTDLHDVLKSLKLLDISTTREMVQALPGNRDVMEGEPYSFSFGTEFSDNNSVLLVTMNSAINLPDVRAEVTTVGRFGSDTPIPDDPNVLAAFIEQVAVMMLFPFARESLRNAFGRVGAEPLVLPMLLRGTVSVAVDDPEN